VNHLFSQTNTIHINANLNATDNTIKIAQKIVFFNNSTTNLNEIYFHNWANAFRDKNTPLAKRFVENYSKTFHFAKEKQRGSGEINGISVNYESAKWEIREASPDILKVILNEELKPKDSIVINATFSVKIPNDKFTGYGENNNVYNLRYWYLTPAIYDGDWKIYSHLDIDDLYVDFTDYHIKINTPENYIINSDLDQKSILKENIVEHTLTGNKRQDIQLNITQINDFTNYEFDGYSILTNIDDEKLSHSLKTTILQRELYFIQTYLGSLNNKKIVLNKIDYDKNPVYGFNQLPDFLAAYNNGFEWDIKLLKVLLDKYISESFLFNKREDYWLANGLQSYLMIKYVEQFYPEVKAIGNISKLWGVKNFSIAKIDFNEKYHFVYQFAARKNLDQALTESADSLSNFNRKISNNYKSGLGLRYLEEYLETGLIKASIWDFSKNNFEKKVESAHFLELIKSRTDKDLTWFENDYLNTNKKIDYTINNIKEKGDSLQISISNKRNFPAPIQLYGLKDKEIKFKKWIPKIDSTQTITIPKNGFDKLSLNYEALLPEYNLRNNWKDVDKKLFNRPLQLKFFKDIDDAYYNQLFYTPTYRYNYYDGLVLGLSFSNKTLLNKSFNYKITPSYGFKSRTLSGSFSFLYEYLPENKNINKFALGVSGANYHYANDLSYKTLYPYALFEFKRKSLRDISSKAIMASYALVDRDIPLNNSQHPETYKYNVFNLSFGYAKPEIIDDVRLSTGLQVSNKFSKLSLTAQYRKLTDANRQFDFRFFAGAFLSNNTKTDYFSFALDRPTDYLFQYDYLGRSETSGFFSQQIIINEGGFKSKLEVPYGNQWLTTFNTSIGVWRWVEIYNDVGFVKNKGQEVYFAHENGVRLNFIQDILEVYFPFHSNLGWEVAQPNYSSKIRFVLVIKPKKIFNFIKRGFY
jgi:hypothetical protein